MPQILLENIRLEEGEAIISEKPSSPESRPQSHPMKPFLGVDGRELVRDQDKWPFSVHGHLLMRFEKGNTSEWKTGSGTLIGPRHILTAAHNLYNTSSRKWAQEVLFAPGRYRDAYPFSDARGTLISVCQEWITSNRNEEREKYDLGLVLLDYPLGIYTGWAGLLAAPNEVLQNWPLSVTGYPADKGRGKYIATEMYTMQRVLEPFDPKKLEELRYRIDTYEGQSGGSIGVILSQGLLEDLEGPYTVGVHTYGKAEATSYNRGTRLTFSLFDRIIEWIQLHHLTADQEPVRALLPSLPPLEWEAFLPTEGTLVSWAQRARKGEGKAAALYKLARSYEDKKSYDKAFAFYRELINPSYSRKEEQAQAFTALGRLYAKGWGVPQSLLQAISFYHQAAKKEDGEALRCLGEMSLKGRGRKSEEIQALAYFQKAVEKGEPKAHVHLASFYKRGVGVVQSEAYAHKLYEKAKALGYKKPILELEEATLSDEEVLYKANKKLFQSSLQALKNSLKPYILKENLFICYFTQDKLHQQQVEKLAKDLVASGIPEGQIMLDLWSNRPGCSQNIFQYADEIFAPVNRVLMIGSPGLKEMYNRKQGRGLSTHQLDNISMRELEENANFIIPFWLSGTSTDNFPQKFRNIQGIHQDLPSQEYYLNFFALLQRIYQLPEAENPITKQQKIFSQKKESLTPALLERIKAKLLEERKKKQREIENELADIFGL